MPKADSMQWSFAGGEWAQDYQGRIDDPYIDGRCEYVRLCLFEGEKAALEYNARWLKEPAGLKFIEAAMANAGQDWSGAA